MQKLKKFILGATLVAGLAGNGVAAYAAPTKSKAKPKTEQVAKKKSPTKQAAKKYDKVYRDQGVFIAKSGTKLIYEINSEKFSESVKKQRRILEKTTYEMRSDYLKDIKKTDPYNYNYYNDKGFEFVKSDIHDTQKWALDMLLNHRAPTKQIADRILSLLLMTNNNDIRMASFIRDVNGNMQDNIRYQQFIAAALAVKIARVITEMDIENTKQATRSVQNNSIQK